MTEARLFLDVPALLPNPMFEGSFVDACKAVWSWNDIARSYARIETDDWTYTAADLESMRREDQGEI